MKINDARKFIAVLMVTYPNYKPIDAELAAKTWADVTEEYTYEQANVALRVYMNSNTSGFAPVPGQIIENIHKIANPQELNETEAWALVRKAIGNGQNAVEEFGKLPPLVQKAVGIPDQLRTWGLDEHFNDSVVMSHFISCYRSVVAREKEFNKMPADIRNRIESVNSVSYAAQIEQKNRDVVADAVGRRAELDRALEDKRAVSQPPDSYYELMESLRG